MGSVYMSQAGIELQALSPTKPGVHLLLGCMSLELGRAPSKRTVHGIAVLEGSYAWSEVDHCAWKYTVGEVGGEEGKSASCVV
jgi:hypothetical protein